jgi:hypothetical protein
MQSRAGRIKARRTLAVAAALGCLFACGTVVHPPRQTAKRTESLSPNDHRVVIFIIDGPRYSETFGDPSHQYVPGMWNALRPLGTLCSKFPQRRLHADEPGPREPPFRYVAVHRQSGQHAPDAADAVRVLP